MTLAERAHRIGRDNIHTYWSNELAPRLTVRPGDIVTFETLESSDGRVPREIATVAQPGVSAELVASISAGTYPERSTVDRQPHITRGHPLTGPVAVEGAKPGDTLVVEVLRIEPGEWGFTACSADPQRLGLLNDFLDVESYHHIWDLRGGDEAEFKPGIRVPLAPFCGVMGVAPAEPGQHSTIPPGRHGGNLDLRHLTEGSTLCLPVLAPGALLSIGDAHAAQGDGEVCGTGIEMDAVVTVRLDLRSGGADHPWVVTSGRRLSMSGVWQVSVGCAPDLREAAREALRGMLEYLVEEHGLTRAEAYVLASVCVDLRISQAVDMPNYTVGAYFPLRVFL